MSNDNAKDNVDPAEVGPTDKELQTEEVADPGAPDEPGAEEGQEDPIGYGRPPKHTQFRPGQSGNPKGRPKGSKNLMKIVEELAKENVVIRQNGRRRTIDGKEAVLRSLFLKALDRDSRAIDAMLKLFSDQEAQADVRAAVRSLAGDEKAILRDLIQEISEGQPGEEMVAEDAGDLADEEVPHD